LSQKMRRILTYILVLLLASFIAAMAMAGVALIPRDRIQKQLEESAEYLTQHEEHSEEENADTTVTPDGDPGNTDAPPVEIKKPYAVELSSNLYKENIEPLREVNTGMLCPVGVSALYTSEGIFLVDYEGNVVTDNLGVCEYGLYYCDVCCAITDHAYVHVDPETFEVSEVPGGHGGYDNTVYYDPSSGECFYNEFGYYVPVGEEVLQGPTVAILASRRPATEEEREWQKPKKEKSFATTGLTL